MARPKRHDIDQALLTALACGATVEQAARQVAVAEGTVYRRLADATFQARLTALRVDIVERTARLLTDGGIGAVETLVDLQQDEAVPAGVRRRAARDVLEMGTRLRENVDLEQRLAALEERLAQRNQAKARHRFDVPPYDEAKQGDTVACETERVHQSLSPPRSSAERGEKNTG